MTRKTMLKIIVVEISETPCIEVTKVIFVHKFHVFLTPTGLNKSHKLYLTVLRLLNSAR